MAVVDLGKLRFDWKGDFSDQIDYEERDVVRYEGDIWFFKRDHAAGVWNPSEADLMLVSADVLTTEGDLIIADSSGLQTRLPIEYDFSMERQGNKFLRSYSTIPDPATVNKAVTVANNAFYIDGQVLAVPLDVAERDTIVFDTSDASVSGYEFKLTTLPNGIHGGNQNTHVSTISDGTSVIMQVSSSYEGPTDGGDAVNKLRCIYSYVSDSNTTPSYAGTDFPYVIVQGELTQDANVTATLGTQDVNGVNVLTVNGRPAYQYLLETDHTTNDAVGQVDWVCFDYAGNTTNNALNTSSKAFSFDYTTGVTYTGTQGTTGSQVTWVVPDNAPDEIYVYDNQTAQDKAEGFTIASFVHPQTANVEWADNKSIIQVHRSIYTGGTWDGNRSWNVIPGSSHTFTPTRSDTKIKYRFNYAYAWYWTDHAIEDSYFDIDGSEQCKWSLNAQYLAGRDNFEWVVDSWGAGVAKPMRIYTRNYADNSHSVRYHTTYYWNGTTSHQNCYAQLEITEYVE
jgi:hypothetical protein